MIPQESRRSFLSALSAACAGCLAALGLKSTTATAARVEPALAPITVPTTDSAFRLNRAARAALSAYAPKLQTLAELGARLTTRYELWYALCPPARTEHELTTLVYPIIAEQWKLLMAREQRTLVTDAELLKRHALWPIAVCRSHTILSPVLHIGPVDPVPGEQVTRQDNGQSRRRPFLGDQTFRLVAGQSGSGYIDVYSSGYYWKEGTPGARFGYGVAMQLHDLAHTVQTAESVGDITLRLDMRWLETLEFWLQVNCVASNFPRAVEA